MILAAAAAPALFLLHACAPKAGDGAASTRNETEPRLAMPAPADAKPVDYPGLHNVVAYADGLLSGSVPEGEAGFDTLAALGVRTIISVDGAQPELEPAKARGMRYVHLPIGYDGVPQERGLELARAVKELPAPIYVHCHHGKHRSAGAAGVIAVNLGLRTPEEAIERMRVSKTSPSYKGLYRCVELAQPVSERQLALASNAFPERWRTTGLVQGMVEIDHTFEHLKAVEKAGWKVPVDHPDLVPAAEAGRLADLLRDLANAPDAAARPAEFVERMRDEAQKASLLEAGLVAGNVPAVELTERFRALAEGCTSCHRAFRD